MLCVSRLPPACDHGSSSIPSSDGTKLVGPSFKGIYDHKQALAINGQTREITVNDEYIIRSIYEPDAEVVEGYRKGQMVTYKNQLSEDDIKLIIEYLKTIK